MKRVVLLMPVLVASLLAQAPPSPELMQAAADASVPALRTLYEQFTTPHDSIHLKGRERFIRVAPLSLVGTGGQAKVTGVVPLVPLEAGEKADELAKYPGNDILSHRSYEWLALEEVDRFQKKEESLSALDRLSAAERVLVAVLQFHESERKNGIRKGNEWGELRNRLHDRLFSVRLEHLQARTTAKDWEPAIGLSRSLLDAAAKSDPGRVPAGLDRALGSLIENLQADGKAAPERRLLLTSQFSQIVQPVAMHKFAGQAVTNLKKQALTAFQDAETANSRTPPDVARAQEFAARSALLWPDLPEAKGFALNVQRPNAVLRVGVRELPEFLSPARALTDNERRAVDLIFESLLRPHRDVHGMLVYSPSLAEGPPTVIPGGRRFLIGRNAAWSDGKPVLPTDIRHALTLARTGKSGLDSRRWGDLLLDDRVDGPPRQVDVLFRHGTADPLGPTTFKLVPSEGDAESEAFARKPLGSGPFQFGERKQEAGREILVLKANPNYGRRYNQSGLPALREVHFVQTSDPVEDFVANRIDVALDVTAEQVAAWRARLKDATDKGNPQLLARLKLNEPTLNLSDRRVFYLAVNHELALLKSPTLRIALSRSIQREEWQKDLGCIPLSSLYPQATWAAVAARQDRLSDVEQAGAQFRKEIPAGTKWTLKIPAGDPALKRAFDAWAKQVGILSEGKCQIEVVDVPSRQLLSDVEAGKFELAYHWYDHPDDTFWLGPMFPPIPVGGKPPFGFKNQAVADLLSAAREIREFGALVNTTKHLAGLLGKLMPVVPLWQRAPRHLLHDRVKPVELDPQRIFGAIDRWTVN